jgi:pilus assembly protein Flp/PilA
MRRAIRRYRSEAGDWGASAVEYGLMVAAIAAAIVGVVFLLMNDAITGPMHDTCTVLEQKNPMTAPDSDGC